MDPEPIEFAQKSKLGVLSLLGASLFIALGMWLALRPQSDRHTRLIGWGNVLFFGACGLVFLRDVRRPVVFLRLDSSGIEYRHPQPASAFHFAWSTLDGVRLESEERTPLLILTLRDPAGRFSEDIPDWAQAKGASPLSSPKEATLSPAALGTTAELLAAEIDRFRRYYGRLRPDGTNLS